MSFTEVLLPLFIIAKALIAGGETSASDSLGSSELYTEATGTFSLAGRLITPRAGHTQLS